MPYRTILTPVEASHQTAANVAAAARFARTQEARLIGLHVPPARAAIPELRQGYGGRMMAAMEDRHEHAAVDAEAEFRSATHGVADAVWEVDGSVDGEDAAAAVCRRARSADLAVVPQIGADETLDDAPGKLPERLVMESGRPVVVLPYAGQFPTIGQRVLVAWNESREAARAMLDALPLLARAEQVWVLTVDDQGRFRRSGGNRPSERAAHAVAQLAAHGIKAQPLSDIAGGLKTGQILLSRAADLGADLMVLGAYGHSRLREMILGGVTRDVLQHMTVPVLMSH
jgi:nucleotide-binding universal stress UspA family protein